MKNLADKMKEELNLEKLIPKATRRRRKGKKKKRFNKESIKNIVGI